MNILLDECVPWPMHRLLVGHSCTTAYRKGWAGLKNGDLIRHAEAEFELFITADQNIRYQQNLASRRIAILELSTNKLDPIELAADLILATVAEIKPAEFRRVKTLLKCPHYNSGENVPIARSETL